MSGNLYEKVKEIAEYLSKVEVPNRPGEYYFSHHQEDLYLHDKDTLEKDSQPGDHYVYIVKGNGCGTNIVLTGDSVSKALVEMQQSDSRFFLISCEDVNKGTVKELSHKAAIMAAEQYQKIEGREPSRKDIHYQMNSILGLNNETLIESWSHTRMASEVSTIAGDQLAIKVAMSDTRHASIEMVRTKFGRAENEPNRDKQKRYEVYYAPVSAAKGMELMEGSKYYLIDRTDRIDAPIKEITKRVFDNARNKVLNPKHESPGLGI